MQFPCLLAFRGIFFFRAGISFPSSSSSRQGRGRETIFKDTGMFLTPGLPHCDYSYMQYIVCSRWARHTLSEKRKPSMTVVAMNGKINQWDSWWNGNRFTVFFDTRVSRKNRTSFLRVRVRIRFLLCFRTPSSREEGICVKRSEKRGRRQIYWLIAHQGKEKERALREDKQERGDLPGSTDLK